MSTSKIDTRTLFLNIAYMYEARGADHLVQALRKIDSSRFAVSYIIPGNVLFIVLTLLVL